MAPVRTSPAPTREPDLWIVARRHLANAWRMSVLWVLFGAAVGLLITPAPRGPIDLVAFAIAGAIVLAPLGAVLGLLGARRRDALATAALGTTAGALGGAVFSRPDLGHTAAMGLIIGSVMGTSFVALCCRLPRLIIGMSGGRL